MGKEKRAVIRKSELVPKILFTFLANEFTKMSAGQRGVVEQNLILNVLNTSPNSFDISCIQATNEELQALKVLRKSVQKTSFGAFPYSGSMLNIYLGCTAEGTDYVSMTIKTTKKLIMQEDGAFIAVDATEWKNFMYYGNGKLFCKNMMRKKDKIWPCTMKDLFETAPHIQRCLVVLIMEYFAQSHLLWEDLRQDFLLKSAYSAIPLEEIWVAHSREELLRNHYGCSMKRNNKETIGQGIFLIQARRVVKENELQKLHGFHPGQIYIGRKKSDLAGPLATYILQTCPEANKRIRLPRGLSATVNKTLVRDAIIMDINLRRKISITYYSARGIYDWHENTSRIYRCRNLATVNIPRHSKFKKLKLPENCVRLVSRRQFVEEGDWQNNCVASYIDSVNADRCSIWSMRKDDGTRNTIEICCRKSKENPDGYFYIRQMSGFGNSQSPAEDYAAVKKSLERQRPHYVGHTEKEENDTWDDWWE